MPLYTWECKNCGKALEVHRKMDDIDNPPEEKCCEKPEISRVPPKTNVGYGLNWSKNSWKDGKGGKGNW